MPFHTAEARAGNESPAKKKKFIQSAIKRPGALRAKAKEAGAITKEGTIKKSFILAKAKKKGRTGQQARFAITLAKLRKK